MQRDYKKNYGVTAYGRAQLLFNNLNFCNFGSIKQSLNKTKIFRIIKCVTPLIGNVRIILVKLWKMETSYKM